MRMICRQCTSIGSSSVLDANERSTTPCVSCLDAWAVFVFGITDKSSISSDLPAISLRVSTAL